MRSKIEQDGTVHFLFNDHPKNNANYTQKLKKFKGKKKSSLMLATLTKDGKLTKKELCYNKLDKRTPWINSTFWNNNTVYMYSSKKEGYQLGKYTLK